MIVPFHRTIGINVFGKGEQPTVDPTGSHYEGTRINVKVGQVLVVSPYVWHATAMPCPIYTKKENRERWFSGKDSRLHISSAKRKTYVEGKEVDLPDGESCFSNPKVAEVSEIVFKNKQITK
jgi:hypothetical protein